MCAFGLCTRLFALRLQALVLLAGVGLLLAACSQSSVGVAGKLEKPHVLYVAEPDLDPALEVADAAMAAQLRRRMSGLTDDALRSEMARRAGVVIQQQIISALRSAGLPAMPGSDEEMRVDQTTAVVGGKLRNAEEPGRAGRPGPRSRTRVVAELKLVYIVSGSETRTVLNVVAEDNARPTAPSRNAPAGEGFSPEMDGHLRRVSQVANDRLLGFAAEQGWIRPQAPAAPAVTPGPPRRR